MNINEAGTGADTVPATSLVIGGILLHEFGDADADTYYFSGCNSCGHGIMRIKIGVVSYICINNNRHTLFFTKKFMTCIGSPSAQPHIPAGLLVLDIDQCRSACANPVPHRCCPLWLLEYELPPIRCVDGVLEGDMVPMLQLCVVYTVAGGLGVACTCFPYRLANGAIRVVAL